jgi:outer membrane protein OmpA-like peptidoglycan-associated protein
MSVVFQRSQALFALTLLALPVSASLSAQELPEPASPSIVVSGEQVPDTSAMTKGPEIKGIITARSGDKMMVTAADGTRTVVFIDGSTKIKSGGGMLGGGKKLGAEQLLNGLPVTVRTMQAGPVLLASQITFKGGDLRTASMIRSGTEQGFAEQSAATEALRGRMGDIDKYNIKGVTNVYFDTAQAALTPQSKAELCATATQADGMNNALILVVGYTDARGSEEYNQALSERRAASVINYLQQYCQWKPYRMLTPTGMAESDPAASNDTAEGMAQNRRVSVNILVSKGLDGM